MATSRRQFLRRLVGSAPLVALGPTIPEFLSRAALACHLRAEAAQSPSENVLVVIQMSGGNDGLNTVIPYADDEYNRNRILLRLDASQVLKINDHVGLHPQMQGFERLLQQGQLAVVQGVGYPNPDRSHFRSMDIWHAASMQQELRSGWLGKYLDQLHARAIQGGSAPGLSTPATSADRSAREGLTALHFGSGLPLALQARATAVPSLDSIEAFQLQVLGNAQQKQQTRDLVHRLAAFEEKRQSQSATSTPDRPETLLPFLRRSALAAYTSSLRVQEALGRKEEKSEYPGYDLARRLRMIAQLIDSGLQTRIYYTELAGFDTHANQANAHAGLLSELAESVAAFMKDLTQRGHAQRVLVMTFSEFGRRVRENASAGTDHGAAAPMFLAGGRVKAGAIGEHPSLTDLDSGDLKHHTDFRRVYATLLERWLGHPSRDVLDEAFAPLDVLLS